MSAARAFEPEGWPRPRGYSDAMAAEGRIVCVAGQVGWDPRTQRIVSPDFVAQTRRALENVVAALAAAGAGFTDVVRLTWYVTDRDAYLTHQQQVGAAYREVCGRHYPAMSVVVVAALIEAGARVEIEATAVVPR